MKKTIGILAHVDAGKTTLSERVLYLCGAVRSPGRVDHGNASLDDNPMEQARGITIYASMARLKLGEDDLYWLDTPGHTDFTPEMERALAVMDAAVLVISASAGVQSHTETLWRLLEAYGVPTFVFLNKLDLPASDPAGAIAQLRKRCSEDMIDLREWQAAGSMPADLLEELAIRDESLMPLLDEPQIPEAPFEASMIRMIAARQVFPVMAGAALTGEGVASFLSLLNRLARTERREDAPFGAVCWKVTHDSSGQRLCHVKLLSGALALKDSPGGVKINDIRCHEGIRLRRCERASAGDQILLGGCDSLRPGDALGEAQPLHFHTEPMMSVDVRWEGMTQTQALRCLRTVEDEEPSFGVEASGDRISIRVMGPIQLEILQTVLRERFGLAVTFGEARVLYRETIAAPALGIGHYEPLRHYAEAWLRLVPLPAGSGIRFRSLCHVDELPLHFQRLIETHVFEREYRGVLTGAPLTDVEVQLLCGRAHLKHTEGGDFRQAVARAIRNALMHAQSVLLEPVAGFTLQVPGELYGAVMGSLRAAKADVSRVEQSDGTAELGGEAPYASFRKWQDGFMALTHGRGNLRVWMSRYAPCAEADAVIAAAAYNPLERPEDSPDSVFCSHGAGFTVAWDQVRNFAHCSWEEKDSPEARQ